MPDSKAKRVPKPAQVRPALRIGYLNVQGLSETKWRQACILLETTFDLLFLAETWFVTHGINTRDPRIVCTSTKPAKPPNTRLSGSIVLLGTANAQGMVESEPAVTKDSVSVNINGMRISAVYFPPSMPVDILATILKDLCTSSVILGDINTRFCGVRNFGKQPPGPKDRIRAFASFQSTYGFRLEEPDLERPPGLPRRMRLTDQLGVDHCLVARSVRKAGMKAITTSSLQFATDHRYAIGAYIGEDGGERETRRHPRYAIARLAQDAVQEEVCRLFRYEAARAEKKLMNETRVDIVDILLMEMCQRVCQRAIPKTTQPGRRAMKDPLTPLLRRQDFDASIRLFKMAKASGAENHPITPTATAQAQGLTAMDEITAGLIGQFQADHFQMGQSWKKHLPTVRRCSSAMDCRRN